MNRELIKKLLIKAMTQTPNCWSESIINDKVKHYYEVHDIDVLVDYMKGTFDTILFGIKENPTQEQLEKFIDEIDQKLIKDKTNV